MGQSGDSTQPQSEQSESIPEPSYLQLMPADGDVVIFIRRHGRACVGYVRHGDRVLQMPSEWTSSYDATPVKTASGKLIRVTAKVGWTQKQWKAAAPKETSS